MKGIGVKIFALLFFFCSLSYATDGRLSVATGNPVPETDITTSTLYLTGGATELSLPISGTLAGKNYDVFEYSGALCFGPAWTNNTTRSIAVQFSSGEIVNSSAMTCTNGATTYNLSPGDGYLRGGFRAFATGQTRSTKQSRLVWDARSPILTPVVAIEPVGSWQYASSVFRQVNGNPANQIEVFNGLSGRPIDVEATAYMVGGTSTVASGYVGIGLDSSVADSSTVKEPCAAANVFPVIRCKARFVGYSGIGYHEFRWLEAGIGLPATWLGNYYNPGYQTGIVGTVVQ